MEALNNKERQNSSHSQSIMLYYFTCDLKVVHLFALYYVLERLVC
jgi:hypothetical protein